MKITKQFSSVIVIIGLSSVWSWTYFKWEDLYLICFLYILFVVGLLEIKAVAFLSPKTEMCSVDI